MTGDPPPGAVRPAWRRVVLVGFMGAGKTRVGREAARLLDWSFVDVDQEIEWRSGRRIPTIFRESGEAVFREIEAAVTADLLARSEVVLATGGGWPAAPGRMESLAPDALSVWLQISPEDAVARIQSGRGRTRPLLQVEDPLEEARRLVQLREPFYRQARLALHANRSNPRALARLIRDEVVKGSPDD
jgi:shikimate kinase